MNAYNIHLFELINAPTGLGPVALDLALGVASGLIWIVPVGMAGAWIRGDNAARRQLFEMLVTVVVALGIAQVVAHVWPQPRPFMLQMGTQYLAHSADSGLPSDHVTVLWSLAFAAFTTRRFAIWGLPLLSAGLLVGWARVFLGVHFPFDVVAALPVALVAVGVSRALRSPLMPVVAVVLYLYHRFEKLLPVRWRGRTRF